MGKQELQVIDNWKSYRSEYQEKAEEIVAEMTLIEKISLMSGRLTREEIRSQILNKKKTHYNETPYWAGGLVRKNVMPLLFVDGSRGVVCGRGKYTTYPAAILRGATFDRELETRIGEAIAEEVLEAGGNLFGGVCINMPYHPGWGRMQECFGEDSFLLGEMGAALVRGIQNKGVIACIKHFAFNSMENNRLNVNISCDKRAEREVFLPQFKKCIDAGAGAVMTAYNSFQGIMCGQNHYLIRDVLKKEWDFDGIVISDFTWGISDTVLAAKAGMDVEMPHTYYYGDALKKAVEKGIVKEELIDAAAIRIVRTMLAHGEYVLKVREELKSSNTNRTKQHIQLALQSAREGITLLENRDEILPLKCSGKGKKIALLGILAEDDNTGDKGSSCTYPPYVVNAKDGIWKQLSGAELIVYTGQSRAHCKRLAKEADAVIIIAGNSYRSEGEHIKADEGVQKSDMFGGDRVGGLALSDEQVRIVDAVNEVRKDAVLVLTGGGPIIVEEMAEKVGAVLMQYYPGMEGGTALGEILFGKVNPSGRLPFAVPECDEDTVSIDWEADEQIYQRYHGYTLLDKLGKKPRYPFGYGLSYTKYEYSNLKCEVIEDELVSEVTVRNIGSMSGETSVLMFVGAPGKEIDREKKLLRGFTRIGLKVNESKTIQIRCNLDDLSYYDDNGKMTLEKGTYQVYISDLETAFEI